MGDLCTTDTSTKRLDTEKIRLAAGRHFWSRGTLAKYTGHTSQKRKIYAKDIHQSCWP